MEQLLTPVTHAQQDPVMQAHMELETETTQMEQVHMELETETTQMEQALTPVTQLETQSRSSSCAASSGS